MVEKSELRLWQHVNVRLCGGEVVGAVVDGLCNDWVGVRLDRGGYVIADWENIEEVDAEEVVRTEQGDVLAEKKAMDMVSVECGATVCKLADRAWVTPDDEKKFHEAVYCNFVAGQKVVISIKGDNYE